MMSRRFLAGLAIAWAIGGAATAHAQHPLDPLSAEEIRIAARVMQADPRLKGAAFSLIAVAEPAKEDVLAWKPGRPLARKARVMAATSSGAVEVSWQSNRAEPHKSPAVTALGAERQGA